MEAYGQQMHCTLVLNSHHVARLKYRESFPSATPKSLARLINFGPERLVVSFTFNIRCLGGYLYNASWVMGQRLRHWAIVWSWCSHNPLTAKLLNLNFHPLEIVSRWRDPQLQVSENYADLTKWRSTLFKYCWLMSHFIFNMFKRWYLLC